MGNILQAKVEIEGTRSLLWHHFGPDSIPLEKKERSGVAGHDPNEWKKTYTALSTGQLYIDSSYVFGCLRGGASYTKRGRSSLARLVVATVQVLDEHILINRYLPMEALNGGSLTADREQDVYLDIRPATNPTTKAKNIRYRVAAKSGWKATFHLLWDASIISRGEMEAIAIDAGRFVGVGSGRTIGFGRFDVTTFNVGE